MTTDRVNHTGRLLFEKPSDLPPKLSAALVQALKKRPEVYEAYILMAREEHEEKPHLLFLIDFDGDASAYSPMWRST